MSSANASSRALRMGARDGRTTCPLAHPTQGCRTRTDTAGRAGREWRSSHTRPLVEAPALAQFAPFPQRPFAAVTAG